MKEIAIAKDDDDIRLDRWFKRHYPHVSNGHLQKLLRKGAVRLDGKKVEANIRVQKGQKVRMPDGLAEPPPDLEDEVRRIMGGKKEINPRDAEMLQKAVIYKDEQVIALNKPAGLAVQGGSKISKSVDGLLDALCFDGERPRLTHRLDKDTSGVLLLGRTASAAAKLAEAFRHRDVEKTYWALIVGRPHPMQGEINLPIAKLGFKSHGESELEKMGVEEEGQHAITRYRVVEALSDRLSWVELFPLTGRTHQLRVHMAAIGHPILGDGKYGGKKAFIHGLSNALHLHARSVLIPKLFKKKFAVEAPLAGEFNRTFKALGLSER